MSEWLEVLNTIATVGALPVAAIALIRANRKEDADALTSHIDTRIDKRLDERAGDVDRRIDERIQMQLGPDIAVIKTQLASIQATLAGNATREAALVRNAVDAASNAITRAAKDVLQIVRRQET